MSVGIDRTAFEVSYSTGSLRGIAAEGTLTDLCHQRCSLILVASEAKQTLGFHHQHVGITEDGDIVGSRTVVSTTDNLVLVQTIALLLIGTGIVDRVNVEVVGQDTRTCPVVSLEVDGVAGIGIGDVLASLLSGVILRTTCPGVSQATVILVVSADPLGNTTAAVIASSSRAVGLDA